MRVAPLKTESVLLKGSRKRTNVRFTVEIHRSRTLEKLHQRHALLIRVTSACRTVSTKALQGVSGTPPIVLIVKEYKSNMYEKEEEITVTNRERTIEHWQEKWETGPYQPRGQEGA